MKREREKEREKSSAWGFEVIPCRTKLYVGGQVCGTRNGTQGLAITPWSIIFPPKLLGTQEII